MAFCKSLGIKSCMTNNLRHLKLDGFNVTLTYLKANTCLVALKGELDFSIYDKLTNFVLQNLLPDEEAAIIDLRDLEFMDSHGIRFIVKLMYQFGAENVALYRVSPHIHRILAMASFDVKISELNDPEELDKWISSRKKAA